MCYKLMAPLGATLIPKGNKKDERVLETVTGACISTMKDIRTNLMTKKTNQHGAIVGYF